MERVGEAVGRHALHADGHRQQRDEAARSADERHEVAEAYGSWVEKKNYGKTYWGTARTTFLVDPEGRIARTWAKVKAEGHAAEVLAALEALQAAHAG